MNSSMKTKLSLLIFFFIVTSVMAQDVHPSDREDVKEKNSRIYGGPLGYYLRLKVIQPQGGSIIGTDKIDGPMGGGFAAYDYKKLNHLYVSTRGFYGLGRIKNGVQRFIHEWDAQGRFGYNYVALQGAKLIATFYSGFGFNYKIHSRSSGNGTSSIKLKYFKYYIPVGLLFDLKVVDYFHFMFDFTWIPDIDPTVKIGGIPGARLSLKHKQNFMVQTPLVFLLGDQRQWEISVVPFWRSDKDGRTKPATVGDIPARLPEQVYIYWGGQLLLGYRF